MEADSTSLYGVCFRECSTVLAGQVLFLLLFFQKQSHSAAQEEQQPQKCMHINGEMVWGAARTFFALSEGVVTREDNVTGQ